MKLTHATCGSILVLLTTSAMSQIPVDRTKIEELKGHLGYSANVSRAQEPEVNSSVWLEKGCIALSYFAENGKWVEGEELAGMQVQLWLNGCMVGINSMCFASDPSPKLTYPPKGWNDGRVIAPMILKFMKANPEIPPLSRASSVVTAWYLSAHPDSTPELKRLSKTLIDHIK